MKYPRQNGFVGHEGMNVPLKPYPDDHPVVAAFPDLFTDTPPPGIEVPTPKRRGRPLGSKNKVKSTPKADIIEGEDNADD